jgi:conjugative transfer signal peptidase TraF
MSQPILMAMLALTIATILSAAIAIVAAAHKRAARAIKLTAIAAVIAIAVVVLHGARLRINFTSSMPIGVYSLTPLPADGVERGMLVAACAPLRAAEIGRQRDYLAPGPCADRTELLLKFVVAIAGDEVDVTLAGVTVNGYLLDLSVPAARDRSGRKLTPWPSGHYRLSAGQVWLYAANGRSWDSRYWGPVPADDVQAGASPVLVVPRAFRSSSNDRSRSSGARHAFDRRR